MQDLHSLIEQYLSACLLHKGLNCKTIKAYRIDLLQFSRHSSGSWYSKEQIADYLALLQQKYKVRSVKRKIASLKAFFFFLEYEEILCDNPFTKIRVKLKEPLVLPRTIPLPTIERLLFQIYSVANAPEYSKIQTMVAIRDVAVVELLFASGMRISELCALKATDINLQDGTIRVLGNIS